MFSLYHLQMDAFVLVHCPAMGILVVMVDCILFVVHIFAVIIITKFVANFTGKFDMLYVSKRYIKNKVTTYFIKDIINNLLKQICYNST